MSEVHHAWAHGAKMVRPRHGAVAGIADEDGRALEARVAQHTEIMIGRTAVRLMEISARQPAECVQQKPLGYEHPRRDDIFPIAVAGKIGAAERIVPMAHGRNQLGGIANGTANEFRSALGQRRHEKRALR